VSLREEKKRQMREQLSDTATRMFLQRGFDGVRVAEVARACGVSEKTVFNYFPTKEALLLDRLDTTMAALRDGLADPAVPPVEAALRMLDAELDGMTAGGPGGAGDPGDPAAWAAWAAGYRRFGDLIDAAPSLRAFRNDMMDRFVTVAAEVLAARTQMAPGEPEPQIAAAALLGLWRVQFQSLRRHADGRASLPEVRERVRADVRRAARVVAAGLDSLPAYGKPA
jgi:AcrR family transcriptional regulator